MEDFVTVSVRIKPTSNNNETSSSLQVISQEPAVLLVLNKGQTYHFDNIFTDDTKQENVYNETVKPFVDRVKSGYNCTVFGYGQTGTGKTYTIGTNPDIKNDEEWGLIQRTLDDFFNFCPEDDNETQISVSFIEIYNEMVFDLLTPNNKAPLTVKGFRVQGFRRVTIYNTLEGLQHLKVGSRQRHTGETKQNSNSSRSHAIFSIYCRTRQYSGAETLAKLNLVDLAGSESVKKTGNQGASFQEGININKGLLSLGQVMTALSTNSHHVPYRQSIITTILQDSLNKRNFISLIACISPNVDDLGETLQTLEFSTRVKRLKNKPEINEFISQYKKDNPGLFATVNRGMTPSKRPFSGYKYETPFKKVSVALPVIQEPTPFGGGDKLGELSLLANPLFSSSCVSETPQNLSPVIRKYINQMEISIINKLESVIQRTLRRSKRLSTMENKENVRVLTPVQLYRSGSRRSTPLNNTVEFMNESYKNVSESSKVASFENNFKNNQNISTPISSPKETKTNTDDTKIFKVPELITTVKSKNIARRSSIRLQNKRKSQAILTDATNFDQEINQSKRRCLKLQTKNYNDFENSVVMNETNRRRSVRLTLKKNNEIKNVSPCSTCESKKTADDPVTSRSKKVLDILNNGTAKEVAKLHTIGPKTAENILLYREVKGKFKSVSDVVNLPYWTQKKCDKFLDMNFAR